MRSPTAGHAGCAAPALLALLLVAACSAAGASSAGSAATTAPAVNGTGYCMVAPPFDVQETSTQMFLDIAGAHGRPSGFCVAALPRLEKRSPRPRRRRARRVLRPALHLGSPPSVLPGNSSRVLGLLLPRPRGAPDAALAPPAVLQSSCSSAVSSVSCSSQLDSPQ